MRWARGYFGVREMECSAVGECCRLNSKRSLGSVQQGDVPLIAQYLAAHLSYNHVPALAKRPGVEVKTDSDSAHELLAKQVSAYGKAALSRLLLEASLLDSAYGRFGPGNLGCAAGCGQEVTAWTPGKYRKQSRRTLPPSARGGSAR